MKEKKGRNGGVLRSMEPGDSALPGAGRKANPFKEHIKALADGGVVAMDFDGWLLDSDGAKTGELVRVRIDMPSALAVVVKMYRKAARKGDVAAARWLTETGFGKTLNLANDEDNPIGAGFAVILPDNGRK